MLEVFGDWIGIGVIAACFWAVASHRVRTGIFKGPGMGMLAAALLAQQDDYYSPDAVNFFIRLGALMIVIGVIKDGYLGSSLPMRRASDLAELGRRAEDKRAAAHSE